MPELPEVETTITYLKENIINYKIIDIIVNNPKMIKNIPISDFISELKNETILEIKRRGKYIIFLLTNNKMFISHLRMSGSYRVEKNINAIQKHDHLIFIFRELILFYNDPRAFGTFNFYYNQDFNKYLTLGYEPLEEEFNALSLKGLLSSKKQNIKAFLLDQKNIAGIGNIYADEILFEAKILPSRRTDEINDQEIYNIVNITKDILNNSIKNKGTTFRSFSFGDYKGNNLNFLKVYRKELCQNCNEKIKITKIASRSTYFCSNCQK